MAGGAAPAPWEKPPACPVVEVLADFLLLVVRIELPLRILHRILFVSSVGRQAALPAAPVRTIVEADVLVLVLLLGIGIRL